MIHWEKLYWKLCEERQSEIGHNHHIYPKHTKIKNNTTVKLSFRDHVLAHYIRYKWLHEKNDRMSVQVLIRRKIKILDDEILPIKIPKFKITKTLPKIKVIKTKVIKSHDIIFNQKFDNKTQTYIYQKI